MASKNNIRGWLTDINNVGTLAQSGRPHDLFAFKINYNQVEDNTTNGVVPLYNGNISETYWRSYNDNVLRNYGYTYDALNRLEEAFYQKPGYTQPNVNNYREKLTYDPNGNITHLWRNGDMDATNFALEIDDLTYTYAPDSNLLLKVTDATAHAAGFRDDATDGNLASDPSDDYAYDAMGNMVKDENKTIRSIKYNHLNLPTFIDFGTRGTISYLYDATGRKVRKVVRDNVLSQNTVTDYANGFQYENNIIQFFPTAEGYASRLTTKFDLLGRLVKIPIEELPEDQFTYVYNYTDHLGNIRLSYAQDPDTQQLKIVEQNHYYPFGLRHTNYSGGKMQVVKEQELKRMAPTPEELLSYKYKYNGKEWQDELGLNMYDYGARNYDAAIGRWMNVDPLAEKSRRFSPYVYALNNPIYYIDPDGMLAEGGNNSENYQLKSLNYDKKTGNYTIKESVTVISSKTEIVESPFGIKTKVITTTNTTANFTTVINSEGELVSKSNTVNKTVQTIEKSAEFNFLNDSKITSTNTTSNIDNSITGPVASSMIGNISPNNEVKVPLKNDQQNFKEMTPDMPGAADGPTGGFGRLGEQVINHIRGTQNQYSDAITKSKRLGKLEIRDFNSGYLDYKNTLNEIVKKLSN